VTTVGRSRRPGSGRVARVLAFAALGWTLLVTLYWVVVPAGSWESVSQGVSPTGEVVTTVRSGHDTLLEHEGSSVLIVLAVPVVLTVVGTWPWSARHARRARLSVGWLLLAGVVIGAMTIGLFYLPAAVLLLVAAFKTPRARDAERDPSNALGSSVASGRP